MKGWKTWVPAIGTIALGVYEITQDQLEQGIGHITMGLGLIGIGHKVEKQNA